MHISGSSQERKTAKYMTRCEKLASCILRFLVAYDEAVGPRRDWGGRRPASRRTSARATVSAVMTSWHSGLASGDTRAMVDLASRIASQQAAQSNPVQPEGVVTAVA